MRKNFWMRHVDEGSNKPQQQPSWVWGLADVLGHRHWRFNIKKIIKPHKHGTQHRYDDFDSERELLLGAKPSPATKRRSIGSRIKKAFLTENVSKGSVMAKPQRTHSIRRDDEIYDEWKHPIIFVPHQSDIKSGFNEGLNVLEIFKVDKDLLVKHLHHPDQGIANFSRSALRLNSKPKLSKSRSFPLADSPAKTKLKPATLEDKQKDVWLVPREKNSVINEKIEGEDGRKRSHLRCSSLNDSMDKYTRLFEKTNSHKDVKLNTSRSFRLGNGNAQFELSFRRLHSLPRADSCCSILSFDIVDEGPSQDSLVMISKDSRSAPRNIEEDKTVIIIEEEEEEGASFLNDIVASQQSQVVADIDKVKEESDPILENTTDHLLDPGVGLKSLVPSNEIEIQFSQGSELEGEPINDESICTPSHKPSDFSDMEFIRQILEQSGIVAAEVSWNEQALSPKVFEEVESFWNHPEQDEIIGFHHHQLLFDLVNEMLGDAYDVSVTYYPKPLSSCCHVRPFPYVVKEVSSRVESLVQLKPEEKQSIDSILLYDQGHDCRWMNLQLETECVALDLEDMLFNELIEEIFS